MAMTSLLTAPERPPVAAGVPPPVQEQHSLPRSVALHLFPGAALLLFVVAAAALGIPPVVALLAGIALVIVPLELGYLLLVGRRRNGRLSLEGVVRLRERLPKRTLVVLTVPLVAWFVVCLFLSVALLDERIASSLFAWYPESIREFATFEGDGATCATWAVLLFFLASRSRSTASSGRWSRSSTSAGTCCRGSPASAGGRQS
jgi:hypothetical protein